MELPVLPPPNDIDDDDRVYARATFMNERKATSNADFAGLELAGLRPPATASYLEVQEVRETRNSAR